MCFSNPEFLQAFNSAVAAEKAPAKRKSCAKSQNAKQRMLRSATISLVLNKIISLVDSQVVEFAICGLVWKLPKKIKLWV